MCHLSSANIRYLDLYFGPGSQDIFHLIWKKAQIFVLTQHSFFYQYLPMDSSGVQTAKVSLKPLSTKEQLIKTTDYMLFLKENLTYFT